MRTKIVKNGLTLKLISGTYVVVLGIDLDTSKRDGLLGFAIKRTDKTENESYWLKGMRAFKATHGDAPAGSLFSTYEQPIQDFLWSDFTAKPKHEYEYEVVPVRGTPKNLTYDSGISATITTEAEHAGGHSLFFNRGVIGSEAYARKFGADPRKLKGELKTRAYQWLSRGLEEAMLEFIGQANKKGFGLRAAVYQFDWDSVSEALGTALKKCGDVRIIYDGRIPGGKKEAENQKRVSKAKAQFKAHGLTGKTVIGESILIPRTHNPSYISHNKFIVLLESGKPVAVWTGSTNFTESGIFAQSNVGHLVRDANVARLYYEYWLRLAEDPASDDIKQANEDATPTLDSFPPPRGVTPIFSPRANLAQLDWYAGAMDSAKDLDCFTAAFGVNKLFLAVFGKKKRYLRYIFLEKWAVAKKDAAGVEKALSVDPLVQAAVGADLPDDALNGWLNEISNTISVNVRYTHNKFALIDPLGDDPVVITGSANFSDASTTKNDENMLVIRGDTRVADIYLGEYLRLWRHHRFRDIVIKINDKTKEPDHNYLVPDERWTGDFYKAGTVKNLRRITFSA